MGIYKEYTLSLDIKSQDIKQIGNVVQNDLGSNVFNIRLKDGQKPYDITEVTIITFSVLKPSGAYYINTATAGDKINGEVTVTLGDSAIDEVGDYICTIELYCGSQKLTSAKMRYGVTGDITEDADVTSESEYPVLLSLVESLSAAEALRVTAEGGRVTSETSRVEAEAVRETAETAREIADSARTTAETSRETAEEVRVTSETSRVSNEILRESAEAVRESGESTREDAEADRIAHEILRCSAEEARISDEVQRTIAETSRNSSEASRSVAEAAREFAKQAAIAATDRANNAAQECENIAEGIGYTLPIATTNILGGVKSGGDISISESGEVTVTGGNAETLGGNAPSAYAGVSHSHTQIDITGLEGTLSGKANTSHGHTQSDITGLETVLTGLQPSTDSSLVTTDKTVAGAINEVFQSVSNGKTLVAGAITDMGVTTGATDTFATMAANISNIETGVDTTDATAVASNILSGKTAYVNDTKIRGTMTNRTAETSTIATQNGTYTIPSGYHGGSGIVKAAFSNLTAGNVKKGVNIGGVVGTVQALPTLTTMTLSGKFTSDSFYNNISVNSGKIGYWSYNFNNSYASYSSNMIMIYNAEIASATTADNTDIKRLLRVQTVTIKSEPNDGGYSGSTKKIGSGTYRINLTVTPTTGWINTDVVPGTSISFTVKITYAIININ